MFCKLFCGLPPACWVRSSYILGYVLSTCWINLKLYCWSQATVYSVFPLERFAAIYPDASRSLTNSVAASVFPSGKLCKDNELKRPKKLSSHLWRPVMTCYHICINKRLHQLSHWDEVLKPHKWHTTLQPFNPARFRVYSAVVRTTINNWLYKCIFVNFMHQQETHNSRTALRPCIIHHSYGTVI